MFSGFKSEKRSITQKASKNLHGCHAILNYRLCIRGGEICKIKIKRMNENREHGQYSAHLSSLTVMERNNERLAMK